MTDYIKREDAIEILKGWKISGEMILAPVPSADVVEVVRCKDCRFKYPRGFCESSLGLEGYCSRGERVEA